MMYRIPLVFTPQPESGYTVTSPAIPELITEGDTLEEAQRNVEDAFEAVKEIYTEQNRSLAKMNPVTSARDSLAALVDAAVQNDN